MDDYFIRFAYASPIFIEHQFLNRNNLDRLYLPMNVNDIHWVFCIVYLDKRLIKIYDSLNITDIGKKCSYIGIMIHLVLYFLGCHSYDKNSESDL